MESIERTGAFAPTFGSHDGPFVVGFVPEELAELGCFASGSAAQPANITVAIAVMVTTIEVLSFDIDSPLSNREGRTRVVGVHVSK